MKGKDGKAKGRKGALSSSLPLFFPSFLFDSQLQVLSDPPSPPGFVDSALRFSPWRYVRAVDIDASLHRDARRTCSGTKRRSEYPHEPGSVY